MSLRNQWVLLSLLTACLAANAGAGDEAEKPRLVIQVGHSEGVASASFSQEGRLLATADRNGSTVVLWHVVTGRELRRFSTTAEVVAVASSPSGRFLAAADVEGHLCVFDVKTGRKTAEWAIGHRPAAALALQEDGHTVVTAEGRTVTVWDARMGTGKRLHTLEHVGPVSWLALSGRGGMLLAGSAERIRCFDLLVGKARWDAGGHRATFSPDEKTVLVGGGTCSLLQAGNGAVLRTFQLAAADPPAAAPGLGRRVLASFTPDGARVVAMNLPEGEIVQWDTQSGELRSRCHSRFDRLFKRFRDDPVLASDGSSVCVAGPILCSSDFWVSGVVFHATTGPCSSASRPIPCRSAACSSRPPENGSIWPAGRRASCSPGTARTATPNRRPKGRRPVHSSALVATSSSAARARSCVCCQTERSRFAPPPLKPPWPACPRMASGSSSTPGRGP